MRQHMQPESRQVGDIVSSSDESVQEANRRETEAIEFELVAYDEELKRGGALSA